jgi:Repeat of unknown function (DUF5648)
MKNKLYFIAIGLTIILITACGSATDLNEANTKQPLVISDVGRPITKSALLTNAFLPAEGFTPEKIPTAYRFANTLNGAYFYTASVEEVRVVIANYSNMRYEGPAFEVAAAGEGQPVFRFANTITGGYFYTASEAEKLLIERSYPHLRFEGSTFSVANSGGSNTDKVYRLANLINGSYLYTVSAEERDYAVSQGNWRLEQTSFEVPASPLKLKKWSYPKRIDFNFDPQNAHFYDDGSFIALAYERGSTGSPQSKLNALRFIVQGDGSLGLVETTALANGLDVPEERYYKYLAARSDNGRLLVLWGRYFVTYDPFTKKWTTPELTPIDHSVFKSNFTRATINDQGDIAFLNFSTPSYSATLTVAEQAIDVAWRPNNLSIKNWQTKRIHTAVDQQDFALRNLNEGWVKIDPVGTMLIRWNAFGMRPFQSYLKPRLSRLTSNGELDRVGVFFTDNVVDTGILNSPIVDVLPLAQGGFLTYQRVRELVDPSTERSYGHYEIIPSQHGTVTNSTVYKYPSIYEEVIEFSNAYGGNRFLIAEADGSFRSLSKGNCKEHVKKPNESWVASEAKVSCSGSFAPIGANKRGDVLRAALSYNFVTHWSVYDGTRRKQVRSSPIDGSDDPEAVPKPFKDRGPPSLNQNPDCRIQNFYTFTNKDQVLVLFDMNFDVIPPPGEVCEALPQRGRAGWVQVWR